MMVTTVTGAASCGDMANHADLRTTRLYDRRSRKIRQAAVEKIIL